MKTLIALIFLISIPIFGQKPDTDTLHCYLSDTTQYLEIGSDFSRSTITFTPGNYYFFTSGKSSLYIDTILVVDSGKVNLIPILKKYLQEYTDEFNQEKERLLNEYARWVAGAEDYDGIRKHFQGLYDKENADKPTFEGFINWLEWKTVR